MIGRNVSVSTAARLSPVVVKARPRCIASIATLADVAGDAGAASLLFPPGPDPPPQAYAGISDAGVVMADADESMKLTLRLSREDGLRLRELAAAARYPVKPSTVARALLERALQTQDEGIAA